MVKTGQEEPQGRPDEWKEGQGPAQLPGPGGDGDREGHGGQELHRQHHRGQQLRPAGRARYTHLVGVVPGQRPGEAPQVAGQGRRGLPG